MEILELRNLIVIIKIVLDGLYMVKERISKLKGNLKENIYGKIRILKMMENIKEELGNIGVVMRWLNI